MHDDSDTGHESNTQIIVNVDLEHDFDVSHVAEQLRSLGMSVEQTLESIGVVAGSAPNSRIGEIARVKGVVSVEPRHRYQLPPPDSPVQ